MRLVNLSAGHWLPLWSSLLLLLLVQPLQAADKADCTLPDMAGKAHSLSDYRGKWVLVNYWATWCPPCLEELPELEVFHSNSEGTAVVLGVNMEDIDKDKLEAFVSEQFLSYPILLAGGQPTRSQTLGGIDGLPTSYLISPEGEIVARQVGPVTAKAIRSFINNHDSRQGKGK